MTFVFYNLKNPMRIDNHRVFDDEVMKSMFLCGVCEAAILYSRISVRGIEKVRMYTSLAGDAGHELDDVRKTADQNESQFEGHGC